MPTYEYACDACEKYFEQRLSIADMHKGVCPTCAGPGRKVILSAPPPMIEAMADAGFPGAFHTSGDRLEKRHRSSGQYHTQTVGQAREADAAHRDFVKSVTTTPAEKGD